MIRFHLGLLVLLLAGAVVRAQEPLSTLSLTRSPATNALVWDSFSKEIKSVGSSNVMFFPFTVTNTAAEDVTIHGFQVTCDCTVPESPALPWVLKPGTGGAINIRMRTLGRFGVVTKQVTVISTQGKQVLTVKADIPLTPAPFNTSPRKNDQMMAQKDRQVVFKGSCAACHALPAAGKTGKELFTAACAICHIAEHRAEMVPDLSALPHPTNDAHWRTWITHGKEGSLMPAFAKSAGGILDTNQIESLVEYLVKTYPSKPAAKP